MTSCVVLLAALVSGQHCGSYGGYGGYGASYGYSYGPTYSYAASYYPTYSYASYTPAYVAPKVVVKDRVITKFVEVVPKANYAGLVGDYDRQEKAQAAAAAEVTALKTELARLTTTITSLQQQPQAQQVPQAQVQVPQAQPVYQAQAVPQAAPQQPIYYQPPPQAVPQQPVYQPPYYQTLPAPQKPAPPSYVPPPAQQAPPKVNPYAPAGSPPPAIPAQLPATAVSGISLSRCVECHVAPASRGGGYAIFTAPGVLAPLTADDWQAMEDQVRAGLMPKKGPRFNEQELQAFLAEKSSAVGQALVTVNR